MGGRGNGPKWGEEFREGMSGKSLKKIRGLGEGGRLNAER
jgi:hypothetical protein